MRMNMRKRYWVSLLFCFAGCGNQPSVIPEEKAIFFLVMPKGDSQWQKEVITGFQAASEQFRFESKVIMYEDNRQIDMRIATIPYSDSVPICLIAPSDKIAGEVCRVQKAQGRKIITILCDDGAQPRTAHVGMSPEGLLNLWSIRSSQISQKISKPLFLFGSEPIQLQRLTALIFRASNDWKKFKPTIRKVEEVTQEEANASDFVTAFGRDAVEKAKELRCKVILPVSLDDETLAELKLRQYNYALGADYFQIGIRGFRIARDAYLQGIPKQPITQLQYKEADSESVDFYKQRRYRVPPVSVFSRPEKK